MSERPRIPVFDPQVTEADVHAVAEAVRAQELSGSAPTVGRFEHAFAGFCGRQHAVAVNSGTAALQIAVRALGLGAQDEVLVPAMTNVASAFACVYSGALPVPVDAAPADWNLDLHQVEAALSPRTRAIMPVHLFGMPVDMERVAALARQHNLYVIEDAAEAHGAEIRGARAGSFGAVSCFSFYANKVISTGEGGMALTDDDALAREMRKLRNMYFGQPRFLHERLGYSFRMPAFSAALGLSQLARVGDIVARKRELASWYSEELAVVPGLQLAREPAWGKSVYWMYAVVVEPEFGLARDALIARLAQAGIETRTFFCPMNQQPALRSLPGWRHRACPVADRLWQTGMYLPSSLSLTRAQVREICDIIRQAPA